MPKKDTSKELEKAPQAGAIVERTPLTPRPTGF